MTGRDKLVRTDAELWFAAAGRATDAFGVLFERRANSVFNYCLRRTADWELAEDVLSATFLEAWRRRDEVRLTKDSALPWLLGVATNLLRNDRRSRRRREAAIRRVHVERAEPSFSDEVDQRIDAERQARGVLDALGSLPERDREVIALVAWAGLSYEEAAVALGVPVGTVRSRLSRARAKVAELARTSGHNQGEVNAVASVDNFELGRVRP